MREYDYACLYVKYRTDLLAYARLRCGDESTAEDIVHNAFLKLLERKVRQQAIDNWKGYLFIIVRNETVRFLKRENANCRLLTAYGRGNAYCAVHDRILEKEYHAKFLKTIDRLPPQESIVYELYCVYNWKRAKISSAMALSPSTVKNYIRAVRKKLINMVA